jgi:hypothetical protein
MVMFDRTFDISNLPIHTAGFYGATANVPSKLSDFVVSFYIPTLLNSSGSQEAAQHQILVVAQPSASGQNYLPGTQKELDNIQAQIGSLPFMWLEESQATIEAVGNSMKESAWVHFACQWSASHLQPFSKHTSSFWKLKINSYIYQQAHPSCPYSISLCLPNSYGC